MYIFPENKYGSINERSNKQQYLFFFLEAIIIERYFSLLITNIISAVYNFNLLVTILNVLITLRVSDPIKDYQYSYVRIYTKIIIILCIP